MTVRAKFVECDICRVKPGSPYLCESCLTNRATIGALEAENERLRSPKGNYRVLMKLRRHLGVDVRRAYKRYGSVRMAARVMGMPRSTFSDYLTGKAERR